MNVRNLDRAESFYTEVLGFRVTKRYAEEIRHLMLDTGSAGVHLFESPELDMKDAVSCLSEQGYAHLAFETTREKFPSVIRELKDKKVAIDKGPIVLGRGESIHFRDPDGNHLEIRCPALLSGKCI